MSTLYLAIRRSARRKVEIAGDLTSRAAIAYSRRMDIDVELTGGPAVEVDLDAVTLAIHRRDPQGWVSLHRGRVVVNTLLRYYAETYEGGHWPTIRALLVELRALIPQLRYGGDHAIPHEDVTDAMIARLDALWSTRAS